MEQIYDPLREWLMDKPLPYVFELWLKLNLKTNKNLKEFENESPEMDKFLKSLNDMNQEVKEFLLLKKYQKLNYKINTHLKLN